MICHAEHAINGWLITIIKSAINPVFDLLGRSLLATPRLDQQPHVSSLWTGSLIVANTVFVLLVMAGGLLVMGHQTLQTSYTIKDIAPRLPIAFVLANVSLLLIGQAIEFANGLSAALLGQGVDAKQAAGQFKKIVLHAVNLHDIGTFLILVLNTAVLLGAILTFIYVIRLIFTVLLIAAAPLALMCHALPQTEYLAKLWWRAFCGVLAIQVAQSLVFITAMRVFFSTDPIPWFGVHLPGDQLNLWITAGLLYILIRIPAWISRMIWQGGLSRSPILRAGRLIAMLVIFRMLRQANRTKRKRRGRPKPKP